MHPTIQAFFDPATFTVSYLVSDPRTKAAAIIDPVADFERSLDAALPQVHPQG